MSQSDISYRPEIDGIRATAVVAVILYHAQLSINGITLFSGGFIGSKFVKTSVHMFLKKSPFNIAEPGWRDLDLQNKIVRFCLHYRRGS